MVAKLTPSQKARAKAMSKRKGVKYPNAWSNLKVARGKSKRKKKWLRNQFVVNVWLHR